MEKNDARYGKKKQDLRRRIAKKRRYLETSCAGG